MPEVLERAVGITPRPDFSDLEKNPCTAEEVVALFMLARALNSGGRRLTLLEINKLVFIAHGWILGALDRPLIDNRLDQIQAWSIGPAVVNLHFMLNKRGSESLNLYDFYSLLSRTSNPLNRILLPGPGQVRPIGLTQLDQNSKVMEGLNWIFDTYTRYSGGQLITLTTQADGPWARCYRPGILGRWGLVRGGPHIPDYNIWDYYRRRLGG